MTISPFIHQYIFYFTLSLFDISLNYTVLHLHPLFHSSFTLHLLITSLIYFFSHYFLPPWEATMSVSTELETFPKIPQSQIIAHNKTGQWINQDREFETGAWKWLTRHYWTTVLKLSHQNLPCTIKSLNRITQVLVKFLSLRIAFLTLRSLTTRSKRLTNRGSPWHAKWHFTNGKQCATGLSPLKRRDCWPKLHFLRVVSVNVTWNSLYLYLLKSNMLGDFSSRILLMSKLYGHLC